MTKEKEKSIPKRPRGRPPRGEKPPPGWVPRHERAGIVAQKRAKLIHQSQLEREQERLAMTARAQARALAIVNNSPALKYLERAERLAWLCAQVHAEHVEVKAVRVGEGYELLDIPTDVPRFKAMQLLMDALGDFPVRAAVVAGAPVGEGGGPRQIQGPQVVLMARDNGRGPRPPGSPAALPPVRGGVVDMPEEA